MPGFAAAVNRVSADYFRTMRIPLRRGRDIATTDVDGTARVAVVNEMMASRLWPDTDPVGRTFFIDQPGRRLELQVVGVVGNAERRAPGQTIENFYYVPAAQWYNSSVVMHVRARSGRAETLVPAVRQALRSVDASLPLSTVQSLNDAMEIAVLPQRVASLVSGAMGVFGLLLAMVGIYGTTSFLVSRRGREMAIRMALGATSAEVVRLFVSRGGRAPLVGLGVGLVVATGASVAASKVVIGARVADPVVIVGVPLLLIATVALAMAAPVRRVVAGSLARRLRDE
jgi:hypothetical protein